MRVFAGTDIGKAREMNQDYYYVSRNSDEVKLCVLADGMGGYTGGEIASKLATESVADYIKETEKHVLYRVTPIFEGNNLVASGVLMEAKSVEDEGEGIEFNVYCYNVQPGVKIDYSTGESWLVENTEDTNNLKVEYILNTNSKKFHKLSCSGINSISDKNKEKYVGTRSVLILQGYEPCGSCNP